ncbi:uncharacterized protein LOC125227140 [Leguminivora glycinivorella]|uniref:uncharacterized protein LOC125227140 n=1 Tax=Leguminivora glycinivorella TaxID=1035111 RepID=UPI00200FD566|nr:uncharacterized protein LOC125227140 [Leguminivora glycinivorella]
MEIKCTLVVLVVSICLVNIAVAKPRTTERQDVVIPVDQSVVASLPEKTTTKPPVAETKVPVPARIPCQYDDPTEESVCQEHCMPKGYSYGLCVGYTCSCI